jgi:hypothetical protein
MEKFAGAMVLTKGAPAESLQEEKRRRGGVIDVSAQ